MANTKTLSFVIPTLLFVLQLTFSTSQATVKGGYWYFDSGLEVSNIDSSHFTHLFCAFADLDANTNQVTISSSNAASFSTFTQTVQRKNPSVKTLLSIGGGGDSAIAKAFSNMVKQSSTRKTFIDSSIRVARANNFHGLDLDWEYPSSDTDKTNLGNLLNEWKAAIAQESRTSGKAQLLLTAAVSGSDQISLLQYYPISQMVNNFDFVNAMVYDLFVPSGYPTMTQPPAPLHNPRGQFSGDQGITKWIQLGLPANKLALGLPFYGYAWNLVDGNNHGLFAPANGRSSTPSADGAPGYGKIRQFISSRGAQTVYDSTYVTDYCYSGTTWIGYDDTRTISAKIAYAKGKGLAGYFAWQIGGDDGTWTLSKTASNAWGA